MCADAEARALDLPRQEAYLSLYAKDQSRNEIEALGPGNLPKDQIAPRERQRPSQDGLKLRLQI